MQVAVAVMATSNAFLEPFASHLLAKKMLLKQGFGVPPAAPQTSAVFYGGHYFQQQPQPRPLPTVTYPAYGPSPSTPSYPSYGPPPSPSYPAYGPPQSSYSGYSEPSPQVVVFKPAPPPAGCVPSSNPSPQIDYSNYAEHGGHGFGSYGSVGAPSNGNNGGYGKK